MSCSWCNINEIIFTTPIDFIWSVLVWSSRVIDVCLNLTHSAVITELVPLPTSRAKNCRFILSFTSSAWLISAGLPLVLICNYMRVTCALFFHGLFVWHFYGRHCYGRHFYGRHFYGRRFYGARFISHGLKNCNFLVILFSKSIIIISNQYL